MLLIARPIYGREIECWTTGGTKKRIEVPMPPHFFSLTERPDLNCEPVTRILLSTLKEQELWKIILPDRKVCPRVRDDNSLEANVPYMHVLHSAFRWSQKNRDLLHMSFDIEASSTGQFPNPKVDPVTAISVFSPTKQLALLGEEADIIPKFIEIVNRENPDVIDHYNGGKFDFPYLLERAHRNGIRLTIDREGREPRIYRRVYETGYRRGVDYTVYMNGRISFDVWKEVRFDTSLMGKIKNRQLKTVAKYFFGDEYIKEVNRARMGDLSREELHAYSLSDARITWLLADQYLSLLTYLAAKLEVPLDFIIHRSPSHIGNTLYGRRFKELGIVSDGANFERFKGILWDE